MILSFMAAAFTMAVETLPAKGQGSMVFIYEPKYCLVDPCPQFRIVKWEEKTVADVAADIVDFEKNPSLKGSLEGGQHLRAVVSWKQSSVYSDYVECNLTPGHKFEVIKGKTSKPAEAR